MYQHFQFISTATIGIRLAHRNTSMLYYFILHLLCMLCIQALEAMRLFACSQGLAQSSNWIIEMTFHVNRRQVQDDFVRLLRFLVRFSRFYQVWTWVNLTMVDLTDQSSYTQVDSSMYHNQCINSPQSACVSSWFSNTLLFPQFQLNCPWVCLFQSFLIISDYSLQCHNVKYLNFLITTPHLSMRMPL